MKKFISVIVVFLVLGTTSAYSGTEVLEDFNSYPVGVEFFSSNHSNHFVAGMDVNYAQIAGNGIDNSLEIALSSSLNQNIFSFGIIQRYPFSTPRDLTGGTLSFDIKTNISQTWQAVLTPELSVWSQIPLNPPIYSYDGWRLQDTVGQIYNKPNPGLIDLPMTSEWTTVNIDVNDLIYNVSQSHWKIPDFSNVIGFNIIALQTNTNIIDTGTVSIDNIRWSGPNIPPVPEPGAMMLCGFGGLIALIKKRLRN